MARKFTESHDITFDPKEYANVKVPKQTRRTSAATTEDTAGEIFVPASKTTASAAKTTEKTEGGGIGDFLDNVSNKINRLGAANMQHDLDAVTAGARPTSSAVKAAERAGKLNEVQEKIETEKKSIANPLSSAAAGVVSGVTSLGEGIIRIGSRSMLGPAANLKTSLDAVKEGKRPTTSAVKAAQRSGKLDEVEQKAEELTKKGEELAAKETEVIEKIDSLGPEGNTLADVKAWVERVQEDTQSKPIAARIVNSAAFEIGRMASQRGIAKAAGALSKGNTVATAAASLGTMYQQIYSNNYNNAKAKGADDLTAYQYGAEQAMLEVGTELLGGQPGIYEGVLDVALGGLAKGMTKAGVSVLAKYGADAGTKAGAVLAASGMMMQTIGKFITDNPVGAVLKDTLGEIAEEELSTLLEPYITHATLQGGVGEVEKATAEDYAESAAVSAIISLFYLGSSYGTNLAQTAINSKRTGMIYTPTKLNSEGNWSNSVDVDATVAKYSGLTAEEIKALPLEKKTVGRANIEGSAVRAQLLMTKVAEQLKAAQSAAPQQQEEATTDSTVAETPAAPITPAQSEEARKAYVSVMTNLVNGFGGTVEINGEQVDISLPPEYWPDNLPDYTPNMTVEDVKAMVRDAILPAVQEYGFSQMEARSHNNLQAISEKVFAHTEVQAEDIISAYVSQYKAEHSEAVKGKNNGAVRKMIAAELNAQLATTTQEQWDTLLKGKVNGFNHLVHSRDSIDVAAVYGENAVDQLNTYVTARNSGDTAGTISIVDSTGKLTTLDFEQFKAAYPRVKDPQTKFANLKAKARNHGIETVLDSLNDQLSTVGVTAKVMNSNQIKADPLRIALWDSSTSTIYYNPKHITTRKAAAIATAHELVHYCYSSGMGESIHQTVVDIANSLDIALGAWAANLEAMPGYEGLTPESIIEEIDARLLSVVLSSSEIMEKFANANPEAAANVAEAVSTLADAATEGMDIADNPIASEQKTVANEIKSKVNKTAAAKAETKAIHTGEKKPGKKAPTSKPTPEIGTGTKVVTEWQDVKSDAQYFGGAVMQYDSVNNTCDVLFPAGTSPRTKTMSREGFYKVGEENGQLRFRNKDRGATGAVDGKEMFLRLGGKLDGKMTVEAKSGAVKDTGSGDMPVNAKVVDPVTAEKGPEVSKDDIPVKKTNKKPAAKTEQKTEDVITPKQEKETKNTRKRTKVSDEALPAKSEVEEEYEPATLDNSFTSTPVDAINDEEAAEVDFPSLVEWKEGHSMVRFEGLKNLKLVRAHRTIGGVDCVVYEARTKNGKRYSKEASDALVRLGFQPTKYTYEDESSKTHTQTVYTHYVDTRIWDAAAENNAAFFSLNGEGGRPNLAEFQFLDYDPSEVTMSVWQPQSGPAEIILNFHRAPTTAELNMLRGTSYNTVHGVSDIKTLTGNTFKLERRFWGGKNGTTLHMAYSPEAFNSMSFADDVTLEQILRANAETQVTNRGRAKRGWVECEGDFAGHLGHIVTRKGKQYLVLYDKKTGAYNYSETAKTLSRELVEDVFGKDDTTKLVDIPLPMSRRPEYHDFAAAHTQWEIQRADGTVERVSKPTLPPAADGENPLGSLVDDELMVATKSEKLPTGVVKKDSSKRSLAYENLPELVRESMKFFDDWRRDPDIVRIVDPVNGYVLYDASDVGDADTHTYKGVMRNVRVPVRGADGETVTYTEGMDFGGNIKVQWDDSTGVGYMNTILFNEQRQDPHVSKIWVRTIESYQPGNSPEWQLAYSADSGFYDKTLAAAMAEKYEAMVRGVLDGTYSKSVEESNRRALQSRLDDVVKEKNAKDKPRMEKLFGPESEAREYLFGEASAEDVTSEAADIASAVEESLGTENYSIADAEGRISSRTIDSPNRHSLNEKGLQVTYDTETGAVIALTSDTELDADEIEYLVGLGFELDDETGDMYADYTDNLWEKELGQVTLNARSAVMTQQQNFADEVEEGFRDMSGMVTGSEVKTLSAEEAAPIVESIKQVFSFYDPETAKRDIKPWKKKGKKAAPKAEKQDTTPKTNPKFDRLNEFYQLGRFIQNTQTAATSSGVYAMLWNATDAELEGLTPGSSHTDLIKRAEELGYLKVSQRPEQGSTTVDSAGVVIPAETYEQVSGTAITKRSDQSVRRVYAKGGVTKRSNGKYGNSFRLSFADPSSVAGDTVAYYVNATNPCYDTTALPTTVLAGDLADIKKDLAKVAKKFGAEPTELSPDLEQSLSSRGLVVNGEFVVTPSGGARLVALANEYASEVCPNDVGEFTRLFLLERGYDSVVTDSDVFVFTDRKLVNAPSVDGTMPWAYIHNQSQLHDFESGIDPRHTEIIGHALDYESIHATDPHPGSGTLMSWAIPQSEFDAEMAKYAAAPKPSMATPQQAEGRNSTEAAKMPKVKADGMRLRSITDRTMQSDLTPELRTAFEQRIKGQRDYGYYNTVADDDAIDYATKKLANGAVNSYNDWATEVAAGTLIKFDRSNPESAKNATVWTIDLYDALVKDYEKAAAAGASNDELAPYYNAIEHVNGELSFIMTTVGQIEQSAHLFAQAADRGALYYATKWLNATSKRAGVKMEMPTDIAEMISSSDAETRSRGLWLLGEYAAEQTPKSMRGWLESVRYVAMLSAPTTAAKNTAGNVLNTINVVIKGELGGAIEDITYDSDIFTPKGKEPIQRTKTLGHGKLTREQYKAVSDFVNADWEKDSVRAMVTGNTRYDESNKGSVTGQLQSAYNESFTEMRTGFGKKAEKAVDWVLNNDKFGDTAFLRFHYKYALRKYLAANGLTVEYLEQSNKRTKDGLAAAKALAKARAYATQEAQRATYHESSKLASLINTAKHENLASEIIVGGIIPFTKAPINVAKEAVRFSPLALANTATEAKAAASAQDTTAQTTHLNRAIDSLASGLTGTATVILGFLLAQSGMLSGGEPEDKKEKLIEQLQGWQPYSIAVNSGALAKKLGLTPGTYTLDWAAPPAIALFAGVELFNAVAKKNDAGEANLSVNDVITAIKDTTKGMFNPMIEMSFLEGIENIIESASYTGIEGIPTTLLTNYATQFAPNILSKARNIIDPTVRSTLAPADSEWLGGQSTEMGVRKILNKIPGASNLNAPKVDIWGNPETYSAGLGERILENTISPGYYERLSDDPRTAAVADVFRASGSTDALPSTLSKSFKLDNTQYYYDNAEYSAAQATAGARQGEAVQQAVDSPLFQDLDASAQSEVFYDIYSWANKVAKSDYAYLNGLEATYNESSDGKLVEKVKTAADLGINAGEYFTIKYVLSTYTGKGATRQKKNYCRSIGLSKKQAAALGVDY